MLVIGNRFFRFCEEKDSCFYLNLNYDVELRNQFTLHSASVSEERVVQLFWKLVCNRFSGMRVFSGLL